MLTYFAGHSPSLSLSRTLKRKMAEISSGANGNQGMAVNIKLEEDLNHQTLTESGTSSHGNSPGCGLLTLPFIQKIIAEILGTYFLIFAGCAAVVVNADKDKVVTQPGISIVWGLVVMVMVYSVGHISGAHFNPAVTIAFATCKRFPWKQVPAYILAQVIGSTLASGTLRLLFTGKHDYFSGTLPAGSDMQSLVVEFIITFYLMFVISGVATDNRAIGELAGLAVGSTVLLNVMFAGFGGQADIWGINESSKEFRPSNSVKAVRGVMDLHGRPNNWGRGWGLGLQYYQIYR
ncbi:aquaporin NIP1-1-like isoform X2 [Olea europaea var. sylvestris]|uniref:aquaporin NIP1-1-like isoform X2 n=1 Tax=Olea europaea var. sylvestris TaxID=158386 RepID=UPI000C1D8BBB|nr:aquaporin NIP1-1-like isoform X2 [Olea europaea var. sylvestris]